MLKGLPYDCAKLDTLMPAELGTIKFESISIENNLNVVIIPLKDDTVIF